MISTGKNTSWPANVGLADSTLKVTPARLISVCGIETRKTEASNKQEQVNCCAILARSRVPHRAKHKE